MEGLSEDDLEDAGELVRAELLLPVVCWSRG